MKDFRFIMGWSTLAIAVVLGFIWITGGFSTVARAVNSATTVATHPLIPVVVGPATLKPGKINTFYVTVRNDGQHLLREVSVIFPTEGIGKPGANYPLQIHGSIMEWRVGYLPTGKSRTLRLPFKLTTFLPPPGHARCFEVQAGSQNFPHVRGTAGICYGG